MKLTSKLVKEIMESAYPEPVSMNEMRLFLGMKTVQALRTKMSRGSWSLKEFLDILAYCGVDKVRVSNAGEICLEDFPDDEEERKRMKILLFTNRLAALRNEKYKEYENLITKANDLAERYGFDESQKMHS